MRARAPDVPAQDPYGCLMSVPVEPPADQDPVRPTAPAASVPPAGTTAEGTVPEGAVPERTVPQGTVPGEPGTGPAEQDPAPGPGMDRLVDWAFAVRTATLLSRPGPQVGEAEAADIVASLRQGALDAVPLVASVTRLPPIAPSSPLVVDRVGWIRANARTFAEMVAPVAAGSRLARASGRVPVVGRRVAGAELGTVLAFLGSRVLGQFDPFGSTGQTSAGPTGTGATNIGPTTTGATTIGSGRLLLVAPNVVQVERELEVVPEHFRLWVCLHEETHRAQFGVAPWLAPHLVEGMRELIASLAADPAQLLERLTGAARELPRVVRGGDSRGLVDLVSTPAQRERLGELTAVMSLLEGHADVIMDDVGPAAVPTVTEIRRRFSRRRAGRGGVDRFLRRLLGLEAKMRQYADGARFVRGVIAEVGMDGLNAVWTDAGTLPRAQEISDPVAWVRRVHG